MTTWDVAPDGKHFLVEMNPNPTEHPMLGVENWFDELQQLAPAKR
jgi:hypothetical protein